MVCGWTIVSTCQTPSWMHLCCVKCFVDTSWCLCCLMPSSSSFHFLLAASRGVASRNLQDAPPGHESRDVTSPDVTCMIGSGRDGSVGEGKGQVAPARVSTARGTSLMQSILHHPPVKGTMVHRHRAPPRRPAWACRAMRGQLFSPPL